VSERETGTVKWFNEQKGYGFIARDLGGDIFAHYSATRGTGRRSLIDGQRVEFAVGQGTRGPQAEDVTIAPAGRESPARTTERETGTVKWFSEQKGFGFIARDRGGDIFVHHSDIHSKGHRVLDQGQRVEFTVRQGTKGPQASDVTVLAQEATSSRTA
jgi:CspA family cold shock protein